MSRSRRNSRTPSRCSTIPWGRTTRSRICPANREGVVLDEGVRPRLQAEPCCMCCTIPPPPSAVDPDRYIYRWYAVTLDHAGAYIGHIGIRHGDAVTRDDLLPLPYAESGIRQKLRHNASARSDDGSLCAPDRAQPIDAGHNSANSSGRRQ
jgi:hypothetical protein